AAEVGDPAVVALPLQGLPFQHLHFLAVRARHAAVALISLQKQVLDPGYTPGARRAGEVDPRSAGDGSAPRSCQLDRVTLVINVHIPAVDVVTVDVARGQLGEVSG